MVTERDRFIQSATAWTNKKSFTNFIQLWQTGFRVKNPFFKMWRIFRNTINGRYAEIAEKKHEAW